MDVDEAWAILFNFILNECNRQCPIKEFKIRRDRPAWFSDEITELSCNRDELFSIGRRLTNHNMLQEARRLRNLVKTSLASAKNNNFLNQMNIHKEDPKKFWIRMHKLINKKSGANIDRVKDPISGKLLTSGRSADALNLHFVNAADKLVAKLPTLDQNYEFEYLPTNKMRLDNFVSPDKIKKVLSEFSPSKSSGCLKISARLYLDAFETLHEQLSYLVNLSISTRSFPSQWKQSIVTPIPKKGDRFNMDNTRPISLIHIGGKLIEKIINGILTSYLKDNSILTEKQFGFTGGKSTIDCIGKFCWDVLHNINTNTLTV